MKLLSSYDYFITLGSIDQPEELEPRGPHQKIPLKDCGVTLLYLPTLGTLDNLRYFSSP